MPKREILIDSLPCSDGRTLEMSVNYSLGSSGGYYSGRRPSPRGYEVQARLVKIIQHTGYTQREFAIGDGSFASVHLIDADRFSHQTLEKVAHAVKDDARYAAAMAWVLRSCGVQTVLRNTIAPESHTSIEPAAVISEPTPETALVALPVADVSPADISAGHLSPPSAPPYSVVQADTPSAAPSVPDCAAARPCAAIIHQQSTFNFLSAA